MMNRLNFTIDINANKSKIWNALWDDGCYREWVAPFFEGSYAVTDNWEEGSIVHFLAPDQSGIFSIIEKHIPNKIMQFKHLGKVLNGKEQPIDEETIKWAGATETYTLIDGNKTHTLTVDIDVMDEHLEFMQQTFPRALEIVKKNCG